MTGTIKNDSGIIEVIIPFGAEKNALIPTIRISDSATIEPAGGAVQDFSDYVVYTVTDPEDRVRLYTVLVKNEPEPKSNEAILTNIAFPDLFREGVIDENSKEITLEVGFGTDLSDIVN